MKMFIVAALHKRKNVYNEKRKISKDIRELGQEIIKVIRDFDHDRLIISDLEFEIIAKQKR